MAIHLMKASKMRALCLPRFVFPISTYLPPRSLCAEEKKGCPFEPLGYSPQPKNNELHVTTHRTVGILWDDVLEFTHWAPVL